MGAGACAVLLALTWFAAFHTGLGAHADRSTLHSFVGVQSLGLNAVADLIARLCDPNPSVGVAALIVLIALGRRRARLALAAALVLLGASATTELLKPLVASPRPFPAPPRAVKSWPSGHATVAMSLVLSAMLVAPARLRPAIAAVGAAFAMVVGYSMLTHMSHYPSDLLGGFLVSAIWTLLVAALLFRSEAPRTVRPSKRGQWRLSLLGSRPVGREPLNESNDGLKH